MGGALQWLFISRQKNLGSLEAQSDLNQKAEISLNPQDDLVSVNLI
jgi:hypothetical protein